MKESWQETEIHPMPWTLIQILKYIQSHWNTVFGFIFTRDVKSIIDKLVNELKDSQGNICEKKNALNFFSSAISLSYCIQRIYGSTSASIERLKQLRKHCHSLSVDQICMNTQLEVQLIDSRPLCTESQQKRVFEMFRYVWEVINHVSGMLLDSLDFLHNLQYNRPNPVPNREEAMDFLPRFFPKLKTLKRQMQSVVQSSSSSDLQYKESVSQLFNSLIHFVPQLEVQLNTPTPDTITIEMMELYCGNPNNRECLASGYDELVQFYGLVHQCIMNTDGTSDLN
ncbi:transcriptional protein SWT1-like [Limulus polyphemus]|uniref:Transcriptional protein SWT1-like n=1 Tax=Limulus polyphemus TaxID=6850 RepID=A0ABM1SQ31_LIMPO|nr:transcriptional protein SWT1-like [Limulus polyphemus]XP_022245736.1 transcriptional protein SWT1-like [Limulus polyphemus]XP_022245737.1 transcriptional protein SWT1-like [Limulus polyphemus]